MFRGSVLKLIFGVLILFFSYVFPCFLIPVGGYEYKKGDSTISYTFKWNGKCKQEIKVDDSSLGNNMFYEIESGKIYWGLKEDVKISEHTKLANIENIYTIKIGDTEYRNNIAIVVPVLGAVFALWGFIGLCVPKKKNK